MDLAFLVDTTKCIGCKSCQTACKQWNNLPSEDYSVSENYTYPKELSAITFNHVIFSDIIHADTGKNDWQMMHKKCFHCEIPNCKTVCPAEAIYKSDYWVVIDQDKCIGCGECEKACIYKVPHVASRDYNEYGTDRFINRNKAYKCHACTIKQKDIPACVTACPVGAIIIDYRVKIAAIAKKRLKQIRSEFPDASIYGLNEFGGLHVITILKDSPDKFGLDTNPQPVKLKAQAAGDFIDAPGAISHQPETLLVELFGFVRQFVHFFFGE